MTAEAKTIINQALALPPATKADLVELLLNSMEQDQAYSPNDVDIAWAKEANERFQAFLDGKTQGQSRAEVTEALRARHPR